MTNKTQLIARLKHLETTCEAVKQEAILIRVELEGFHSPAPNGGKKKNSLTKVQEQKLKNQLRKKLKIA